MELQAVFVDRDGTIGGTGHFIHPRDFRPYPGALEALARCAVIGDVGANDMAAAQAVGAVKVLVRTGWGEGSLGEYRHTWADVTPDFIAGDLAEAVDWLLQRR